MKAATKKQPQPGDRSYEEMKQKLAALEEKANGGPFSLAVGSKGGLSVYGLGRFPVTLYYEQWTKLLSHADEIRKFLEANKGKMKLKK